MKEMIYLRQRMVIFALIITTMFLTGCGSYISKYRKAQDQFNLAAEADNRMKFSLENPESRFTDLANISTNYALAYKYISDILGNKKKELEKDNLYGSALTIKGLCEWKLGKFDKARNTSQEALKYFDQSKTEVFTRDIAVMTALPGLTRADQAYYHTMSDSSSKSYDDIEDFCENAISEFKNARNAAGYNHPVQVFLIMSELAVYCTWRKATFEKLDSSSIAIDKRKEIRKNYKPVLEKLKELAGEDSDAYKFWSSRLPNTD